MPLYLEMIFTIWTSIYNQSFVKISFVYTTCILNVNGSKYVCAPVSLHRLYSFVGYFKLVGNKITLNDLYMHMYPGCGFYAIWDIKTLYRGGVTSNILILDFCII